MGLESLEGVEERKDKGKQYTQKQMAAALLAYVTSDYTNYERWKEESEYPIRPSQNTVRNKTGVTVTDFKRVYNLLKELEE